MSPSTAAMPIPSGFRFERSNSSSICVASNSQVQFWRQLGGCTTIFATGRNVRILRSAYTGLASYTVVTRRMRGTERPRQEISLEKIPHLQARRLALSRENYPNEEQRKRKNRMSKKTGCQVRLRVQERPDGSWTLHSGETYDR
jgi:hypothetical protein